jgi:hypothetical protein
MTSYQMSTATPTASSASPHATHAGNLLALSIKAGAEVALFYADALLKTIPSEQFSVMPTTSATVGSATLQGRDINSPAFNLGHLAIYPDLRVLPLIGREDLVRPLPFSADLFKAGAPCVDKPGTYPSKDVLVDTFMARYRAAIDAVAQASGEQLAKENPMEGRMKEMFPTVGAAVNFLLVGHTQSHLGQISVWRRVMGLGSAF